MSAPYIEPEETASGNDMVLGDFEIKDVNKAEQNKAVVHPRDEWVNTGKF